MIRRVVVGFGCPRAGTTFLRQCLESINGSFAFKMNEHAAMHPCNSTTGLLDLEKLWHSHNTAFVRIKRHPMEIVRSFVAARDPKARPHVGGVGANTDADIVEWVESESLSVSMQEGAPLHVRPDKRLHIVTIRYECLSDPAYRGQVADEIVAVKALGREDARAFEDALGGFGTAIARPGRLSLGVDAKFEPGREEWFRQRLAETIEREGYE